jgi:hypothetical protein
MLNGHGEQGTRRVMENALGGIAPQHVEKIAVSIRAHHDQIRIREIRRVEDKFVGLSLAKHDLSLAEMRAFGDAAIGEFYSDLASCPSRMRRRWAPRPPVLAL